MLVLILLQTTARAETVKIGVVKTGATAVVFVALDKGYFADAGLQADLVYFESAQPIAVAAASGAIDFGYTAPTAGLYNLGLEGAVKIVAGAVQEAPGFRVAAYLVSRHAWDSGLRSYRDFAGHSFGISQVGSPPHYALGLLADKYKFDVHGMRLVPLQSIPNIATAIAGGRVDATILTQSPALLPMVERGDVKRLGWVGDETPWQFNVTFASTKTVNERPDTVKRFIVALKRGAKLFHDGFTGPDGHEAEKAGAADLIALLGERLGQTPDEVRLGIGYVDPELRLDIKDVLHQIAWFRSQGMLKGAGDGRAAIDSRYVVPFPGQ